MIGADAPFLTTLIVASAALYAYGVSALWRKAGTGRGIRGSQIACFASGWFALALALLSPIDTWAERSFGIHMAQHELLMVVAAPLLVLGKPLQAWAWVLPAAAMRAFAAIARSWITEPLGAWIFHALALWTWHLPVFFTAALASEPVHVLQHASFFGSALAFWWAVFGRGVKAPDTASMASLFTTMLHTSVLGALLTFATSAWYATAPEPFGLTALEDQQLGGLVMWVPGGLAYLVAGLVIAARWLRTPPRLPSRTGDSPAPS